MVTARAFWLVLLLAGLASTQQPNVEASTPAWLADVEMRPQLAAKTRAAPPLANKAKPAKKKKADRKASAKPKRKAKKITKATKLTAGGVINPMQANGDELRRLPGIGPVLAQRIIEMREQGKVFATPGDLLEVKGIGKKKLAKIEAFLTFAEVAEQ